MATSRDRQRVHTANHYAANREQYLARNRRRVARWRVIILEAKANPCVDCERSFHFAAMHFDHRPGEIKTFEISETSRIPSEEALLAEIAKCDLVCACCHAVRTWERGQHMKDRTPREDGLTLF